MKKLIMTVSVMLMCFALIAVPGDDVISKAADALNVSASDLKLWVLTHQIPEKVEEEAEAPRASEGLIYVIDEDGDQIVVGAGDEPLGDLVIPAMHDGKPVWGIDNNAFEFRDDITSVVLDHPFHHQVVPEKQVIPS